MYRIRFKTLGDRKPKSSGFAPGLVAASRQSAATRPSVEALSLESPECGALPSRHNRKDFVFGFAPILSVDCNYSHHGRVFK